MTRHKLWFRLSKVNLSYRKLGELCLPYSTSLGQIMHYLGLSVIFFRKIYSAHRQHLVPPDWLSISQKALRLGIKALAQNSICASRLPLETLDFVVLRIMQIKSLYGCFLSGF